MYQTITRNRFSTSVRFIAAFLIITFCSTTIMPPGYAQTIGLSLPIPGTMVSQSPAFVPVLLKGMTVYPDNPLQFEFIVDSGNEHLSNDALKKESDRLVKYFMASMTVPQNDLWVNLSPNEKDRIIPDELGKTELGRDLLAQDYILKQLTATMMYPEEELGKKFWDRVRRIAKDKYGITEIPTDTFNKVWILPERAEVYEYENTVYITDAHLKVMLDSDYEAMQQNGAQEPKSPGSQVKDFTWAHGNVGTWELDSGELSKQVIREVILPQIEKEVNEGKNFATLRQIYHSLILAKWYKQTVKNSIMSQVYIDKNKTAGIELGEQGMKEKIYDRYMQAYQKGVFNYIKEDYDELSQAVIPRQYFSGGFKDEAMVVQKTGVRTKIKNIIGTGMILMVMLTASAGFSGDAKTTDPLIAHPENAQVQSTAAGAIYISVLRKFMTEGEIINQISSELDWDNPEKNELREMERYQLARLDITTQNKLVEILIKSLRKQNNPYNLSFFEKQRIAAFLKKMPDSSHPLVKIVKYFPDQYLDDGHTITWFYEEGKKPYQKFPIIVIAPEEVLNLWQTSNEDTKNALIFLIVTRPNVSEKTGKLSHHVLVEYLNSLIQEDGEGSKKSKEIYIPMQEKINSEMRGMAIHNFISMAAGFGLFLGIVVAIGGTTVFLDFLFSSGDQTGESRPYWIDTEGIMRYDMEFDPNGGSGFSSSDSDDQAMLSSATRIVSTGLSGALIQSEAAAASLMNERPILADLWGIIKEHSGMTGAVVVGGVFLARILWARAKANKGRIEGYYAVTEMDIARQTPVAIGAFHELAAQGDNRGLELFLQKGFNINAKNKVGGTALNLAINRRKYNTVKFLLERGADPNIIFPAANIISIQQVVDNMFAAEAVGGHKSVAADKKTIQILIENGVNLELALKLARENGKKRVTKYIEKLQADQAMLSDSDDVGGIDMNTIDIERQKSTEAGSEAHTIQFNMQGMEPLLNMDIQGFSPVIIDMIPINSVLPLLGLMPTEKGIKYGQEEAENELLLSRR
ncbi:MAG: ankyrin repeat domain-containing protein [Candidatus Omnitrophota bacterium]